MKQQITQNNALLPITLIFLSFVFLTSCSLLIGDLGESPDIQCTSNENCPMDRFCLAGQCQIVEEICDQIDNDQDGMVDEGVTNACGLCGILPIEECDELDNDCDGMVDEDYPDLGESCPLTDVGDQGLFICQGGDIVCIPNSEVEDRLELCDAVDNDGDGIVDEEITLNDIACQLNSCRENSPQRCVDGALVNDCTTPISETDTTCDLIDDDCDGLIDEGVEVTMVACGSLCSIMAEVNCVDGVLIDECDMATADQSERCDGLDNDCDEVVDEGLEEWIDLQTVCGLGVCQNTMKQNCQEGELIQKCSADPTMPEEDDPYTVANRSDLLDFCDADDNDCDGVTDEDSLHDLDRCFTPEGEEALLSIRCVLGERQATACGEAILYCDDSEEPYQPEICEYTDSDLTDSTSLDTDGDQLDGTMRLGIFVHPTLGHDQNLGSPAAPVQHLNRALELYQNAFEQFPNETPRPIYLSTGEYELPPYEVFHDLTIVGGYVARDLNGFIEWSRPTQDERQESTAERTLISTSSAGPIFKVNSPLVDLELDGIDLQVADGSLNQGEGQRSSIGLILLSCDVTRLREVRLRIGSGVNGRSGNSALPVATSPDLYRGGDAMLDQGGLGGQNAQCCQEGECAGGTGGDKNTNGQSANDTGTNLGNGGYGGQVIEFDEEFILPPGSGQPGAQGIDATPESLLGAIDLTTGRWIRLLDGVPAEAGQSGGGGGGAAGVRDSSLILSEQENLGGGGGGGAGGCGGQPGQSGEMGGWSIGLTISPACHLSMEQVTIERGPGGQGGVSGSGGSGELGGEGGGSDPLLENHRGALGGTGGCGGHGVSGHGGSSVALLFLDATPLNLSGYIVEGGDAGLSGVLTQNTNCPRTSSVQGLGGLLLEWLCCAEGSLGDPIASCNFCFSAP